MSDDPTFVLLPGLDGTGELFRRFLALRSVGTRAVPLHYPPDRVCSFDELVELVLSELPAGPLVLVGESFSGPIALRVASRRKALGVVLCASMVRAPVPHRLAAAPLSFFLRARLRVSLVKVFLSGGDQELAVELVNAVSSVERDVIASRIRMTLEVDSVADAVACPCPIAYFRATCDRLISARQAAVLREARGDAAVTEIAGPHLLLQAKPEECWQNLRSFAERATLPASQRTPA